MGVEDDGARPDLWTVLERSVAANPPVVATQKAEPKEEPTAEEKAASAAKRKRTLRILDAFGSIFWIYVFFEVFAFDLVRLGLERFAPSLSWLADFRWLFFLGVFLLIGAFLWKWRTLWGLLYVLIFPLVVIVWKLPYFLFKRRNWLLVMGVLNAFALVIRNLRYNIVTKALAILASFLILTTNEPLLLVPSAITIFVLLAWAAARSIRRTLQPNWFFTAQRRAISRVVELTPDEELGTLVDEVRRGEVELLDSVRLAKVATSMSMTITINRAVYFWAYQLQRYKSAQLSFFFNALTYGWLLIGAGVSFGLLNLALLKLDPTQYVFDSYPSTLAMILYGFTSLMLNAAAGISTAGDLAHLLSLAAGLFGLLFLAAFILHLLFSWRRERDDATLNETVAALKSRAQEQEAAFRSQVDVGVEEARRRLEHLGQGFAWLVGYVTSGIPDDFFNTQQ